MTIDHGRLGRVLTRSGELAAMSGVDASVKRVYDEKLAADATAYLNAHNALIKAEDKARKERREAIAALEVIEQPYMKVRAVAEQYLPDLTLPDSLKSCDTDTDRSLALTNMLGVLDEHDDAPGWAQDLTNPADPNSFGSLAPVAIREIDEGIGADAEVEKARRERARCYGIAYERYLGFKNVVRNTYGKSSIHYRRIHIRKNGKLVIEEDGPVSDPVTPA